MTKKQRAQVVELLRCAADNAGRAVFLPLLTAIDDLATKQPTNNCAFDVYFHAFREQPRTVEHERECAALLEAAARVEEGSWP